MIESEIKTRKKKEKTEKRTNREKKNANTRQKTRLMTLNVFSMGNKYTAIEHYLKTNRVHIAVITETYLMEGEHETVAIKDYKLASSCSHKQGETKGGVAIFVHTQVPFIRTEHRVAQTKGEIEYCSVVIFPNHNKKEQLVVVGVYRPPDKQHPPYDEALEKMLQEHKEHNRTTMLLGDFNINDWETNGKGAYTEWILNNDLWELSDPNAPTYRTGTTTDGIVMALGDYHPEGVLPQQADPETDGGQSEVHPVFISEKVVLADHADEEKTSSRWEPRPCR